MNIHDALPPRQVTNTNHVYLVLKNHVTHRELRDFCKTFDFVMSCDGWAIEDLTANPLVANSSMTVGHLCVKNNVIAWLIQQGDQVAAVRSAPDVEQYDGKWRFTLVYQKGEFVGDHELECCF